MEQKKSELNILSYKIVGLDGPSAAVAAGLLKIWFSQDLFKPSLQINGHHIREIDGFLQRFDKL